MGSAADQVACTSLGLLEVSYGFNEWAADLAY
jgi:hypothetical protein